MLCSDATKACLRVDNVQYTQRLLMLQAAIKYEEDELVACKTLVDQCLPDDPDTIINYACITYKVLFPHTRCVTPYDALPSPTAGLVLQEGGFEEARTKFVDAINTLGYQSDLAYNIALCHYCLKQYGPALKYVVTLQQQV